MLLSAMVSFLRRRIDDTRSQRFPQDQTLVDELNEAAPLISDKIEKASPTLIRTPLVTEVFNASSASMSKKLSQDFIRPISILRTNGACGPTPCRVIGIDDVREKQEAKVVLDASGRPYVYFYADATDGLATIAIPTSPDESMAIEVQYPKAIVPLAWASDQAKSYPIPARFHMLIVLQAAVAILNFDKVRQAAAAAELVQRWEAMIEVVSEPVESEEIEDVCRWV